MCLILFAFRHHKDFPLIVIANRDERYARPTLAAHYWDDQPSVFAGKDLEAGGTWMGINKDLRFAAVTNHRSNQLPPEPAISRGSLCKDFLNSHNEPAEYLAAIRNKKDSYAGFNLLAGSLNQLFYFSNRQNQIVEIKPGIHGLSNGLLNESWPKVEYGKKDLEKTLQRSTDPSELLNILLDKAIAPDTELPETGVTLDIERLLSPRFIHSTEYGTRTSTVLMIDKNHRATWLEQHFDNNGPNSSSRHTLSF